jgi:hypothetical protein
MAKTGSNEVLAVLVKVDGSLPITRICLRLKLDGTDRDARRPVIKSLGRLIQRGLAKRTNKSGLRDAIEAEYAATDAGRKFVRDGGKITNAHKSPRVSKPRVHPDSVRQRIWDAFRRDRKTTIVAIAETIRRDGEDNDAIIRNGYKFFAALTRAGVAVEMRERDAGFSPTSNGFKRFAMVKDLGKLAPVAGVKGLFDPNTGERIAYPAKKALRA